MSKICIVGLGNPGEKYKNNRHNIGYFAVDHLQKTTSADNWKLWKNLAFISKIVDEYGTKYLVKPTTYMNLSGMAVMAILKYWQISPSDLVVIHDDLDVAVGSIKFKKDGGHAGHNGIKNCSEVLETKKYYRIRLGVGRNTNIQSSYYVLNDFSVADRKKVDQVIKCIGIELPKLYSSTNAISENNIQNFIVATKNIEIIS